MFLEYYELNLEFKMNKIRSLQELEVHGGIVKKKKSWPLLPPSVEKPAEGGCAKIRMWIVVVVRNLGCCDTTRGL